jgi:hypothetical protein
MGRFGDISTAGSRPGWSGGGQADEPMTALPPNEWAKAHSGKP